MSSMLSLNTVDLRCGICSPAEKTPEETLSYSCNTVKETEMLGAVKGLYNFHLLQEQLCIKKYGKRLLCL